MHSKVLRAAQEEYKLLQAQSKSNSSLLSGLMVSDSA